MSSSAIRHRQKSERMLENPLAVGKLFTADSKKSDSRYSHFYIRPPQKDRHGNFPLYINEDRQRQHQNPCSWIMSTLFSRFSKDIVTSVSNKDSSSTSDNIFYYDADGDLKSRPPPDMRPRIQAFSWHPCMNKWAVSLQDKIFFFDVERREWDSQGDEEPFCLQHQFQRQVVDFSFSPLGGSQFAVACSDGICFWNLYQLENGRQVPAPQMSFFTSQHHKGHTIRGVEFSPCGNYLASYAENSPTVLVWDVAEAVTGRAAGATALRLSSGWPTLVRWSHNGRRLFTASSASGFCVWNCDTWSRLKYSTTKPIQAAVWSGDGDVLLYTEKSSNCIRSVSFRTSTINLVSEKSFDIQSLVSGDPSFDSTSEVSIDRMVWDSTCARLAITFEGSGIGRAKVGLFRTEVGMLIDIRPIGLVDPSTQARPDSLTQEGTGADDSTQKESAVSFMGFQPRCENGALLCICWSDNLITYIPSLFKVDK